MVLVCITDYSYGTGYYSVHFRGGYIGASASGFYAEFQAGSCLLYPIHVVSAQLRIGSRYKLIPPDYHYKSTYDSVSFGYPASGGMMTWIDIPNTSNNVYEHHLTQAGICTILVSFSKDTNKSCRGSRLVKTICTTKVELC